MTSEQVFGRDYSTAYDAIYREKDYAAECDLLAAAAIRYLGRQPGGVLDLGCGTGNHAAQWVRKGVSVHGVDRSADMLAAAKAKFQGGAYAGAAATLSVGDVRSVRVGRTFDVVTMMFAVLGYQTENEDVSAALRTAREHLTPSGLLLCDFWYGPAVLAQRPTDRVRVIASGAGRVIRWASTTIDTRRHTATVDFQLIHLAEGRVLSEVREAHVMRYFFPREIEFHLSTVGLELVSLTAFPTLDEPASDATWNAFLIARKSQG